MTKLGKLEKISDLRSVWQHEALNFTTWLAEEENLALLSETIGIDIILEERESSVRNFNVDIYAKEAFTGRNIIIENQLEDTNHDHLVKVIAHASNKNAKVIIEIVKSAQQEHKRAIEWLNTHTDSDISFFLIEIELYRIDDSKLAPKFNMIEYPNDWEKDINDSTKTITNLTRNTPINLEKDINGSTTIDKLRLNFWRGFKDYVENNYKNAPFSLRKPPPRKWYDVNIKNPKVFLSLNFGVMRKCLDTGLYIPNNFDLFGELQLKKDDIEKILGKKTVWKKARKASRVLLEKDINPYDSNSWGEYYKWLYEQSLLFKKVAELYCK